MPCTIFLLFWSFFHIGTDGPITSYHIGFTACNIMVHWLLLSFHLDLNSYLVLGQGITVTISLYHIHCMKFVSLFQYAARTSSCITARRESDIPCKMSKDFRYQNVQVQSRDWNEILCDHGSWRQYSCEHSQLCAAGKVNDTSGEIVSLHWCKYIVNLCNWNKCFLLSATYSGVIKRRAGLLIFHFWSTWSKLIEPCSFVVSWVIWQPVLSLSLTGQLKP